jgi:hypothetical protein
MASTSDVPAVHHETLRPTTNVLRPMISTQPERGDFVAPCIAGNHVMLSTSVSGESSGQIAWYPSGCSLHASW